ncbi:MAG: efflux RND transporter permease subunit [Pseudomonadota bacterium]|nr:efflux RND transporter permease subunit [Pseudomonadota bacterium]GIR39416.1 MAG: acriflavin resistance protein [Porticoccaceae bacterium]
MKFLEFVISHARATIAIMLLIVVTGAGSRLSMPVELSPNVVLPVVMTMVRYDGISPEDGNRLLVRPIEKELKTIDGIEEIQATASEGYVVVTTEFEVSDNIKQAVADVREAVNRAKADFPDGAEEPIVDELSPSPEPSIVITFSGSAVSERELYRAAKFFQSKLETLPDVLKADLSGHREEIVEVIIDPEKLKLFNISINEFTRAISVNNVLIPTGEIDLAGGRFGIKVPAILESYKDIENVPIKSSPSKSISLGDLAEVRRTFRDAQGYGLINGEKALAIDVRKRITANLIDTVTNTKQIIESYRSDFSENLDIGYAFDTSEMTEQMVNELQGNIITAMCLVLALVVATLGFRSGLLVGFAIPFSILGALIIINSLGHSFNFMVMFGLLLSLGMLIDGAIVVVEHANTKVSEGISFKKAYSDSVGRMAVPVIASTGTTLAAFLPLLFWPGVSGDFMSYLPITVFAVLGWSLLYALVFVPTLGTVLGRRRGKNKKLPEDRESEKSARTLFLPLEKVYLKILKPVVNAPVKFAGIMFIFIFGIFALYFKFNSGQEFFTPIESQYGMIEIRAQGNLSINEQKEITLSVNRIVEQLEGVKQLYGYSSATNYVPFGSDVSRDQISTILVELVPRSERSSGSREIFRTIREKTKSIPGIFVTGQEMEQGPPTGKDIQIQLSSSNRASLYKKAKDLRVWIDQNVEGIRDLQDTLPLAGIQWEIDVDESRAAMLGIDTVSVGNMIQLITNGAIIGKFRPDDADDEVEIRLRFPTQDRRLSNIRDLMVQSNNGPVPIGAFTRIVPASRVDSIQRINMDETVFIMANSEDGFLPDDQIQIIDSWVLANQDSTVEVKYRGANEEQQKSADFLLTAFLLAMSVMLIMLITQFNSFYQSGLILFSVILSTAGVLLGLLISQNTFSTVLTGVGIVALAGIVVNNNIVLIDTYNFIRSRNPQISASNAVFNAARERFRPVMLTTITTVVGLLPLANGMSIDLINRTYTIGGMVSSWWQPLASAIVNGLLVATILTLLLTPAMLLVPEIISKKLGVRVANYEHGT